MWEPTRFQPSGSTGGLLGAGSSSEASSLEQAMAPLAGTAHPGHPPQTTSGTLVYPPPQPKSCLMEPLGP